MASRYEIVPPQGSYFADMRNSLVILATMDQYTVSPEMTSSVENAIQAEHFLRAALFGHFSVPNPKNPDKFIPLSALRARLGYRILLRKRRGVVPNILTYLWFLFAVAISIEACELYPRPLRQMRVEKKKNR